MFFSAHISSKHLVLAAALTMTFVAASAIPAATNVNETVIAQGAVNDGSSSSVENRADRTIPALPVVYDDPSPSKGN